MTANRWLAAAGAVLCAGALLSAAQGSASPRLVKVTGDKHRLALFSDGRVTGWRQFRHGQLGPDGKVNAPGLFTLGAVPQDHLPGKAIDIAASDFTSYAVLDDGAVVAWGRGSDGQLGTGPNPDLPLLPSNSPSFEYRGADRARRVRTGPATKVAAAGLGALALLRDGTVVAWGARGSALIGDGRAATSDRSPVFVPVPIAGAANVTEISASLTHALARTRDGHVLAWGSNRFRALGREPMQDEELDRAGEVTGLNNVIAVAAANNVSTALKRDGTVWVWGSNANGQFGDGVFTSSDMKGNTLVPRQVPGITSAVAITVGLTGRHTLALLEDGSLRGWGNTDWGQLGAGVAGTFQPKPVTPRITGVSAVFAAGNNTFAVKTDGSVWGWGSGGGTDWPFKTNVNVPTAIDLK